MMTAWCLLNKTMCFPVFLLIFSFQVFAAETVLEAPVKAKIVGEALPFVLPGVSMGLPPEGLFVINGSDVRLLSMPDGAVKEQAVLADPVEFAALAVIPDGLVLAGGIVNGSVSRQVICLKPEEDGITVKNLPSLPEPLAMAGAAVMDGRLFVVGGIMNRAAGSASTHLYSLELGKPDAVWQFHESLPGTGRIFPSLISVSSELYVFGGWSVNETGKTALSDSWGFRLKPLDGTVHTGWFPLQDIPETLAAAPAYQAGQAHIALVGGYETGFQGTAVDALSGTKMSDQIWIYHTVSDTWIPGGKLPQPTGAGLIAEQGSKTLLISTDAPPMQLELNRTVKQFGLLDYGILGLYFLAMAGVGLFFASRQKSSAEYALGGRTVKWWAAGISMFATGTSAISFMAIPALAFRTNLVWLTPVLLCAPLALALQAYVLFPLLRRLQITSTFEYLERRFHPSLRFLASLQCIIFHSVGRMSVVLLLPALAISAVSGINVGVSVLIMGLIATFYTATGGFEAVIWTDVIQGLLMLIGVLLMICLAVHGIPGGWGEFIATGKAFHRFDAAIWGLDCSKPVLWMFMAALLVQGISVISDQPTCQRVFSTPLKDVRRLAAMSTFCGALIAALITLAGMTVFVYFRAHPVLLDPGMRNDQVIPLFVVQGVPPGIAGLIIAGIFAASLSTLAGSMNSVAILIGEDFYRRINQKATDRSLLMVMKVASVLVGCFGTGLAYIMAQMPIDSIFQVWNEIIALLGGGFVGIYVLGMFTRRTSSTGAVAGAIGSIICTVLVKNFTPLHWVFYTPFAVFTCLIIGYVASLIFPSRRIKNLSGLTVFDAAGTDSN